jgi:hypothetical protein
MKKKFRFFKDSEYIEEFKAFADSNIYIEQDFDDFKRLVIWATEESMKYLQELLNETKGPYGIMYILRNSRCDNEEARYSVSGVELEQVCGFLNKFEDFFEQDSRHRIVIRDFSEELTYFLYNEENLLLAYGDTEKFKNILNKYGFKAYDKAFGLPDPHMHLYHEEFDEAEKEVLNYFEWIKTPLEEIDKKV